MIFYMNEEYVDFGSFLKSMRLKKSYTQSEIGKRLNVTQQTIFSWENNKKFPSVKLIPMYAKVLGVDEDEMFRLRNNAVLVKDGIKLGENIEEVSSNEINNLKSILTMTDITVDDIMSLLQLDGKIISIKELEKLTEYLRALRIIESSKNK